MHYDINSRDAMLLCSDLLGIFVSRNASAYRYG